MSDYQSDLKISDNILKQNGELYRKIRNTARFLLANIDGLDSLVEVSKLGVLDKWILNKAKKVFDEIEASFKVYEFSKGLNKLNNFLVVDLSGIYLDVCKDRLYCDDKNDIHRTASQTAMAMITKKLISTLACILTYTMDEFLDYAPKIIKGDAKDIFDFVKYDLPKVESNINDTLFIEVKEKFSEIKDSLSKDKVIKSTLELEIVTDNKEFLALDEVESSDWFLVSKVSNNSLEEKELGSFKVEDSEFKVYKASGHKCPRCWKYTSTKEDELCSRCEKVAK